MKINLKKTLVVSKIVSASVMVLGLSFFIVGGYGNKITSLPQIQNSGYFGVNSSFHNEWTNEKNTKTKYVNALIEDLKKPSKDNVKTLKEENIKLEGELKVKKDGLKPFVKVVDDSLKKFNEDRTDKNKDAWDNAKASLELEKQKIGTKEIDKIKVNNDKISKITQSNSDINYLNNYKIWSGLFISGSTLLSIGAIVLIGSIGYSVFLKKQMNNKKENN